MTEQTVVVFAATCGPTANSLAQGLGRASDAQSSSRALLRDECFQVGHLACNGVLVSVRPF